MMSLIKILEHGFDIKEKISRSANEYIQMYGVAPGSDEDLLYEDNCCNGCPRKVWCAGVDTAWWTEAKKRFVKIKRKSEISEKSGQRREEDRRHLAMIKEQSFSSVSSEVIDDEIVDLDYDQTDDPDFTIQQKTVRNSITFPKIPVRDGYQTINEDIMETLVVLISYFKIEVRKVAKIVQYIGNNIFKQEWIISEDENLDE